MEIDVTVVIAHFDGSKFIEAALASVFAQTMMPREVLVVDDGSAVHELEALQALQEKYPFRILQQENAGQSAARNHGVRQAAHQLICFLDQDDIYLPHHIHDLVEAFDLPNPGFAFSYGDLWRRTEDHKVISHSCVNLESTHPHTIVETLIRTNMYILPSATCIRKSIFEKAGGFDERLRGYEDDDLFLRLFLAGYSSRFIPQAVTIWTLNKSSTSFSESMARSRFIYFKKLFDAFPTGSIGDTLVFGSLLVPRFAFQFAADVVSAALTNDRHFEERRDRLVDFLKLFSQSAEVAAKSKRKFVLQTLPLVSLRQPTLRIALRVIGGVPWLLDRLAFPGAAQFLRRFSD